MDKENGKKEIAYQLELFILESLLQDKSITHDEYIIIKKALIEKYQSIIGCLEDL